MERPETTGVRVDRFGTRANPAVQEFVSPRRRRRTLAGVAVDAPAAATLAADRRRPGAVVERNPRQTKTVFDTHCSVGLLAACVSKAESRRERPLGRALDLLDDFFLLALAHHLAARRPERLRRRVADRLVAVDPKI